MRLVCPNCAAQYEVDDGVIPDTGREVQCSACGHLWFQPAKGVAPEPPGALSVASVEPTAPAVPDLPESDTPAQTDTRTEALAETPDDGLAPAPPVGQTPRRQLDDSLLSVLREEAEREAAQRRSEGLSFETQEEMPLEPVAAQAASRAAAKLAGALRGLDTEALETEEERAYEGGGEQATSATRRERLPDIEEINSTLRASSDRADLDISIDAPQTLARNRSGFRFGFTLVLLAGFVAVVLYATAPRLQSLAPPLAPALDRYVAGVDAGRVWLDARLQAAIHKMQDKSGQ